MVAEAVLVVVSLTRMPTPVKSTVRPTTEWLWNSVAKPAPIQWANLVENINSPKLMPPAKSRMVPQSMAAASRHSRVKDSLCALAGRKNSAEAASRPMTLSGAWALIHR